MHRRYQSRELIDADTILRDITPDDLRDQAEINHLRGAIIGHIFYPNAFRLGSCSRELLVYNFRSLKYLPPSGAVGRAVA